MHIHVVRFGMLDDCLNYFAIDRFTFTRRAGGRCEKRDDHWASDTDGCGMNMGCAGWIDTTDRKGVTNLPLTKIKPEYCRTNAIRITGPGNLICSQQRCAETNAAIVGGHRIYSNQHCKGND